MAERRYYWLKLQEDFFSSLRIKKLRKIAGGDTYTIIYLKMQLLSIRNGGVLKYMGLESSFAEELALDLDEDAENVAVTLQYLVNCGLIETSDNIEFLLPFAAMNTGSEVSGAKRVREFRERQRALQSNANVTQVKRIGNGEIDKEIEIDKDNPPVIPPKQKTGKKDAFTKPSREEVRAYAQERHSPVDPDRFFDFFEVGGWVDSSGKPVRNWKQKFITWERRDEHGERSGARKTAKAPKEYRGEDFFDDE